MLPIVEAPELLLELEAARIVAYWRGTVSRPLTCDYAHSGLRCRITLEPYGIPLMDPAKIPTECERDVLSVISSAGRPLTQAMVIQALNEAKMIHGDSTVLKALTRMAKDGRLVHVKRRGYDRPK